MSYEEYLAWKELQDGAPVKKVKEEIIPDYILNHLRNTVNTSVRCSVCGQSIDKGVKS